jgi:hypothetical protein
LGIAYRSILEAVTSLHPEAFDVLDANDLGDQKTSQREALSDVRRVMNPLKEQKDT